MFSRGRIFAGLVFASLALSGCGQIDVSSHIFEPKVPSQWLPVATAEIDSAKSAWIQGSPSDALADAILDFQAWSTSENVTAEDVFSNTSPQRLQAVLITREIFNEELAELEKNPESLEDLVIPISTKIAGDGLEVRQNEVSGSGSVYWLEQEVAWDFSGVTQTLHLVAAADIETEIVTMFWVRCSDTCLADAANEVDRVFSQIQELNR